ncbi:hypothetical protein ACQ4PT_039514 [Festuca glaucescens]
MAAADGETVALRTEVAALRLRVLELERENQRLAQIASSCSCSAKEDTVTPSPVASASLYGCDQELHKGKQHESRTSEHGANLPFDHMAISTEKEVLCNSDGGGHSDAPKIKRSHAKRTGHQVGTVSHCQKRLVALKIMYFGQRFYGFASEAQTEPTIESEVFKALERARLLVSSRKESCYSRCGRTDKGVSATGQVIHIKYVRFSCLGREYKYLFWKGGLDTSKMQKAASKFIGEHDFRNFCKMDAVNVSNYKRRITDFDISAYDQRSSDDELWAMTIKGSAFLWHQVRCMVAVLFLIGQGLESTFVVDSLLDITKTPRKPQYTMAPELPLILRSCLFDKVSFMCSSDARQALIEHFKDEYHQYMLQAAIYYEALSCLSSPEPNPYESHQKKRNHIPLMSRQMEPSYEERTSKVKAKSTVLK